MRVKCLKKFLSCLCAACMAVSMCSSAFAIKTTSCNKALHNAVDICNNHICNIKPHINIYLKKLTEQKKDDGSEKTHKQIASLMDSLSKIKQIFNKLDSTKLNNLNKFNILAFNKNLLDLRTYITDCANQKDIDLNGMEKKLEAFGVNRWSECVNSLSAEDEIDNYSCENDTPEDEIKFFLNNFKKAPGILGIDKKFKKSLKGYVEKYVSDYEDANLNFIRANFKNPDEWAAVFNKYLGSEKFVNQVISAFEHGILNNAVKSLKISTVSDLNYFLERTILKKFSECSDNEGQCSRVERQISRYLGYVLELCTTIDNMYDKVMFSDEYNEFDLNFLALKLRDIEQIFDNMFKDLAKNSWICTLSMSDTEINQARESHVLRINDRNFEVSDEDMKIIDFVRLVGSPINEIMGLMVNDQLGESCSKLTPENKEWFKCAVDGLLFNIKYVCQNLKMSESELGISTIIYDDGYRKFENEPAFQLGAGYVMGPPEVVRPSAAQ